MEPPRIVWEEYRYRLVARGDEYELEKRTGHDAMGVDRWEPRGAVSGTDARGDITIPSAVFLGLARFIAGKVNS